MITPTMKPALSLLTTLLLAPLVMELKLHCVPESRLQLFAVPPEVKAFGKFPMCCFAMQEGVKNA
jgi:hypothetical protein